jgi:hypothetical protein
MSNLAAREAELGPQPRRAGEFFPKYQDRILFGTDSDPVEKMQANYFRWLETADEYFDLLGLSGAATLGNLWSSALR